MGRKSDPPVVLIKWYDFTKWLLDRVDSFLKNYCLSSASG